jgi:hypothetical protein
MEDFDINQWWLVYTNGERFVGKRNGDKLEHVQSCIVQTGVVQDARGNARPRTAVLTFPYFTDTIVIPAGALWISLAATHNKVEWVPVIVSTERLKTEQRAERAGIALVGH